MQDHAVHSLGALDRWQPFDVAIPVLARTILVGGDRAVGKMDLARVPVDHGLGRRHGRGRDLRLDHGAGSRGAYLVEEARLPPSPSAFVVSGARQVEAPSCTRHRHVQEATLLCHDVLAAAHKRLQHRGRQLEPRRAAGLGEPALHQRWDEDNIELKTL